MKFTTYRDRRAAEIENEDLVVTVTQEGGHVASLLHKASGVNPLWTPTWPSIEPSEFSATRFPEFGESDEAQLVAGLLGHCICLDLFGGPTDTEKAAGIPAHGEAPVALYEMEGTDKRLTMRAFLPAAQLNFIRHMELEENGVLRFHEIVENHSCTDRPIGWTQHVTLGAPFLEKGKTRFLLTADKSRVIESAFNNGLGMQKNGADFEWPLCPLRDGTQDDLSVMTEQAVSAGFTAHRMDTSAEHVSFVAWSPTHRLLIGYVWKREDYPWLARWEENHLRTWAPWDGKGFALGMEFGVSPMVENRRDMVARGKMFDTPTFLWLGAKSRKETAYCAFVRTADALPTAVHWDGEAKVDLSF